MPLCLPKSVTVALKSLDGNSLPLANVLLKIQTFATSRNSISLFPFATNKHGVAHITNKEMRFEVAAAYDSDLMGSSAIESAHDSVEIYPVTQTEVELATSCRLDTWTSLLKGEKERWKSIGDLISLYRRSNNCLLEIPAEIPERPKVKDSWIRPDAQYFYEIRVKRKS